MKGLSANTAYADPATQPALEEEVKRGIDALQAGDRALAYSIFERTTAQHPDRSELWVWLGGTSPNLDAAEAAFKRAAELDPNNVQAVMGLRWVAARKSNPGNNDGASHAMSSTAAGGNAEQAADGKSRTMTMAIVFAVVLFLVLAGVLGWVLLMQ